MDVSFSSFLCAKVIVSLVRFDLVSKKRTETFLVLFRKRTSNEVRKKNNKKGKVYEKGNNQQNRQFHCHGPHCCTQHLLHAKLYDERVMIKR